MLESKLTRTAYGDDQWTITITGGTDVFRFAVNMLGWQCDFGAAASEVLTKQRKHVGAKRFDEWARMMLGADRFKRLRYYWIRRRGGV